MRVDKQLIIRLYSKRGTKDVEVIVLGKWV